jgi:osmotically-inducible protein OsmY
MGKTYAGRGPRGYRRSDERIREDLNDYFTEDCLIYASDIEVSMNHGLATLAGRVNSREQKRRAADIAEPVSGVTDQSNQLRVGASAPTTASVNSNRAGVTYSEQGNRSGRQ